MRFGPANRRRVILNSTPVNYEPGHCTVIAGDQILIDGVSQRYAWLLFMRECKRSDDCVELRRGRAIVAKRAAAREEPKKGAE